MPRRSRIRYTWALIMDGHVTFAHVEKMRMDIPCFRVDDEAQAMKNPTFDLVVGYAREHDSEHTCYSSNIRIDSPNYFMVILIEFKYIK